jgi:hypothetical protein
VDRPGYKPVGNVLSSFFEENLSAKAGKVSEFFKSWRGIAGERLSSHSRIAEVENCIVIVEADHPSWIQLLQMRQEEMLSAIERGWPELGIRGIAFRLRRDAPAGKPDSPEASGSRMNPARRPVVETEEESPPREKPRREDAPIKDTRLAQAIDKLKQTIAEQRKPKKN